MINWNVRLRNKQFILALVSAVLLVAQAFCKMFGLSFDVSKITEDLFNLLNAIFVVLTLIGVVNDPTTHGLGDSSNALGYEKPKK